MGAAYLPSLAVYRNGVDLMLELRARPSDVEDDELLGEALHGHARGQDKGLLLGVEFSDGRRASTLGGHVGPPDDPAVPTLVPGGGGGGMASASGTIFLSPLPPPGEVTLVVAWPHRAVPETTFALPTDEILAAASRVRELWPWEPERRSPRRSQPRPAVAEGGWFAATLQDSSDPDA